MHGARAWANGLATGIAAAGALLAFGIVPAGAQSGRLTPRDASTLARQALAALEAVPPDLDVAAAKIDAALHAEDTRGVDMSRVQEAAQAFGLHDPAAAAATLIAALTPTPSGGPGAASIGPLLPVQPHFRGTAVEHLLLACAGLLVASGILIVTRL